MTNVSAANLFPQENQRNDKTFFLYVILSND